MSQGQPYSVIAGTGHFAPERVVTNEELVTYVGGSASWIEERTGICARRWARSDESTATLGHEAARRALDDAGCAATELDALIFATLSPDMMFPGSGVFLQQKLGLHTIPALDVRNQCSGYLYALQVADAWIRAGIHERVLVVGAENQSAGLDISEQGRGIAVLFGDGAGAVVLESSTLYGAGSRGPLARVHDVRLGADGAGAPHLCLERPGTLGGAHLTVEHLRQGKHYPSMNGRQVFRHAIGTLTREIEALMQRHALRDPERFARIVLVPHQANRRINEQLARHFGLADHQVVHTIDEYGNTTAASIPMALDLSRKAGRIASGSLVIHAAFGSGYTWGTSLVEFSQ